MCISLHDHCGITPADMRQNDDYIREGREWYGYEGLAASGLDAVFENFLDGTATITSKAGWKWTDAIHDLGMHLADVAHQSTVFVGGTVDDIDEAHRMRPDRHGAVHGGRRDDRERARPARRALRARRADVRDRVQRVEPARRRREGSRRRWAHALRDRRGPADEPARDGDRPLAHRRRDGARQTCRGERAAGLPLPFGGAGAVRGAEAEGGRPAEGGRGDRRRDRDRGVAAHDDLAASIRGTRSSP